MFISRLIRFLIAFFIFSDLAYAQIEIYTCYEWGLIKTTISGQNNCSEQNQGIQGPTGGNLADLAWHPDGNLYATNGSALFYVNFTSEQFVQIGSPFNIPDEEFMNSLVADAQGILYGASVNEDDDTGFLYTINTSGQVTYKGQLPLIPAGDLFWFEGELYLTALFGTTIKWPHLVKVNIETPENSLDLGAWTSSNGNNHGRGVAIYHDECMNPRIFANHAINQIYEIDMDGPSSSLVCQIGPDIRGMSIPGDYLASECFTCDNLAVDWTTQTPLCFGGSNGSITVNPGGGEGPYDFEWSNNSSANPLASLSAGNYSVTVTDANGCTLETAIALDNPDQIEIAMDITEEIACNGAANGQVQATASGGAGPAAGYVYNWSDAPNGSILQFGATLNDVGAGTYYVTVTDANKCTATASVFIGQPSPMAFSCAELNAASGEFVNDGSISVNINGGNSPYQLQYIGPSSGSFQISGSGSWTVTGLLGGDYSLSIVDDNGCELVCDLFLCADAESTVQAVICEGESFEGYTAPGTYEDGFTTIDGCDSTRILHLSVIFEDSTVTQSASICVGELFNGEWYELPGEYTLSESETTPEGCEYMLVTSLTVHDVAELVDFTIHHDDGSGNGAIDIELAGPSVQSYLWSHGANTEDVSGLTAGAYSVIVTTVDGCVSMFDFTVDVIDAVHETGDRSIELFPNPVQAGDILTIRLGGSMARPVEIFDVAGRKVYSAPRSLRSDTIKIPIRFASGLYLVRVEGFPAFKFVIN